MPNAFLGKLSSCRLKDALPDIFFLYLHIIMNFYHRQHAKVNGIQNRSQKKRIALLENNALDVRHRVGYLMFLILLP